MDLWDDGLGFVDFLLVAVFDCRLSLLLVLVAGWVVCLCCVC